MCFTNIDFCSKGDVIMIRTPRHYKIVMLALFAKLRRRRSAIMRNQVRIGYFRQLLQDAITAVVHAACVIVRHIHVMVVFYDAFHGIVADFRVRCVVDNARAIRR